MGHLTYRLKYFVIAASFLAVITSQSHAAKADSAEQTSSDQNSPPDVNFNFSADNQSDSTSHLGGDVYFGQNFHFGVFGETSKAKPNTTSGGSGSSTAQKSSSTFDLTFGSDQERPFSAAVEFTTFGLKDALVENTLRLPFGFNSDNWSGTVTPGHGNINFNSKASKSRTVDVQIGDNSIAGSISYLGLKKWRFGVRTELHSFTQDLTKLDTTVASYLISNNTVSLAQQINRYSSSASATYSFKKADVGLQLEQSEAALDLSISKSATLSTEIYWNDHISTPFSLETTSTAGTDPTTGDPYPKTATISGGLIYLFD